jgi:hypothetical protein
MKGIVGVLCNFEHEQYPSNSVDSWCLITEYPNEGIGFLVGFGMTMQYPYKFQKIYYGTQSIFGTPHEGYCMFIEFFWA